jgi:hypothetical protein
MIDMVIALDSLCLEHVSTLSHTQLFQMRHTKIEYFQYMFKRGTLERKVSLQETSLGCSLPYFLTTGERNVVLSN